MDSISERARAVALLILDVDGVMTDGRLYFDAAGESLKVFHVRDGLGIKALLDEGVQVAVISGRKAGAVTRRMTELGVQHVYQGCRDKTRAFRELLDKLDLQVSQTAFVGDDTPDLAVMRETGLAIAVSDAHPLVIEHAHWVTTKAGGQGAVREVCELIIDARAGAQT